MSTNNLEDTNPLAFMLFVGAGSILGGILSQVLFPREECPVPEKPTEVTHSNSTETDTIDNDNLLDQSTQSESETSQET